MRISDWSSAVCSSDLSGFPPHPHRDMEIITYVRTGAISHRDSMGNSGRTAAGDVQVMSEDTGVTHSEFNLVAEETTLFQNWILPYRVGGNTVWGPREVPKADGTGRVVDAARNSVVRGNGVSRG